MSNRSVSFGELRSSMERAAQRERTEAGVALAQQRTAEIADFEERIDTWVRHEPFPAERTAQEVVFEPSMSALPVRPALWRRLVRLDGDYRRQLQDCLAQQDRSRQEFLKDRKNASDARAGYEAGDGPSTAAWLALCLQAEPAIDGQRPVVDAGYETEARQLVIDHDVPSFETVPEATGYRYSKQADSIVATKRSLASRKELYLRLLCAACVRALCAAFASDDRSRVDTVVLNAFVNAIEPHTGQTVRPCVLTVRMTRSQFEGLRLDFLDPVACLRSLSAVVSRHPDELVPITPICVLDTSDRRFVNSVDVIGGLAPRPNLMELTPGEFEALITNLFESMGLETRLTQPSRDGGVDCVAFDLRPVLGGKVVIQAKRYAGTVGVSAVRDLYGTVLNEGAGKGILVTTSGYGPAAYEFAANKPLELLSGGNLLALLSEWAGVDARIEMLPSPMPN